MWSFLGWFPLSGSSSTLLWSLFCFKVMEQCLCSPVYRHSLHSWPSVSPCSFVLNYERFAWLLWQVNPDLERFGLIDCTEPDPPSLYLCLLTEVGGRGHSWLSSSRAAKLCLHRGTEKHTCALTSGTFMCCDVELMGKTSVPVCENAACVRHLQQLWKPHACCTCAQVQRHTQTTC